MQIKAVEIRDEGTFIAAIAIKTVGDNEAETFLLRHEGFTVGYHIILVRLSDVASEYDPHSWNCATMEQAHKWILKNFDEMESGQVLDVQFIRGEREYPRVTERKG